jgi:hypothetical protein
MANKKFFVTIAIISSLLIILFSVKYFKKKYDEKHFNEIVEKRAKPALEQMDKKIKSKDTTYDLEETMRVISGLDKAMNTKQDFDQLLLYMSKQDYSKVAPEVVASRQDLLKILTKLYAKQNQLEDQKAFWKIAQNIGSIVTDKAVSIATLDINPIGTSVLGVSQSLEELKKRKEITEKLKADISEIQSDLINYMYKYSATYNKYINEWDKLCIDRDKAYLALNEGDFANTEMALTKVLEKKNNDSESFILKCLVQIEKEPNLIPQNPEKVQQENLLEDMNTYISNNPTKSAPILLLKGNYYYKKGDLNNANLAWKEAAAYYPKQAENLTDMLNPYEMRSYLKKTKEGNIILNLYKATMLGSGYFSPDLQMAKSLFEQNKFEEGKKKVLDHFSRRRAQSQWDNIFADISYCEKFMGVYFKQIFPENAYLDLAADVTTFGNKLSVEINNRSDKRLTNASLILCLQFTDMHRDDYATFKMKTQAVVEPNAVTDFGKLELNYSLYGQKKEADDIAKYRAVLISDEAVTWVDERKIHTQQSTELIDLEKENIDFLELIKLPKAKIKQLILEQAKLNVTQNLVGSDDVNVQLPRALAIIQPYITISKPGKSPEFWNKNNIEDERIKLNFKTDVDTKDKKYILHIKSKYIVADLDFEGDIQKGFTLKNIKMN